MPTRLLAAFFLSLSAGASFAAECTQGSEFEPPLCPLVLPKIDQVSIVENAAKSPVENSDSVDCSGFSINEAQVRRYLSEAKTTSEREAHRTLDWSPCYASGKVSFRDGRSGEWSVTPSRAGSLVIGDGKKQVLYCPRCRFRPFRW